ncbi:MAG: hypothetical protein HRF52_00025 [Ignavibacterium sp.]|jgi:hypothetical protein|uniref:hypothetical protein n=1 Tax=Ignavibacterium sp. TaxID=2651167 RepID=UPI003299E74E
MKDKSKIYPLDLPDGSQEKQFNFIKLIDEAMKENMNETDKELKEAGIDIKEVQSKLLNFINEERAKLCIEKGRLFKKAFEEEKQNNPEAVLQPDVAFAFRKNGNDDNKDPLTEDELKKLALLIKAKNKLRGNPDEQGD